MLVRPLLFLLGASLYAQPARCPSAAQDISALANAGLALSREGKYSVAAECYREALSINPKIPDIQLNLGLAEFKSGHFRAAIAPLRAVISLDSGNSQARTLLGMSYYALRKFELASQYLEPAAKTDPRNAELTHRNHALYPPIPQTPRHS